jgi:hypothetical protein
MAPSSLARETVKDANAAPAQPYHSVDIVEMLLRRGAITSHEGTAHPSRSRPGR